MVFQKEIILSPYSRGFHLITSKIINHLPKVSGIAHLFIKHTSASLTIMENASPDVLDDINKFFLKLVPEDSALYSHGYEGNDDMPAHIKYMLTQTSLTIPIKNKQLILGTWQGIYLFEHRYYSHKREISLSFMGN